MNIYDLQEIVKKGKLYYPASDHYLNQTNNVQCDRCFRNNLDVSIGYNSRDLCLPCADIIAYQMNGNKIINNDILVKMQQDIYKPNNITRMEQNIYKKESIIVDSMCLASYPCKHRVIINNNEILFGPSIQSSGQVMDGKTIANKYWDHLNNLQKKHFSIYLDYKKDNIFYERWNDDFYGK